MAFDIKDPKNQKMIAMFMIPIVILYAFFHFVIKTKVGELETKEGNLNKIIKSVEDAQKTLKSKEVIEKTREELMIKFEELNSLLPEEENVSELIEQFSMVERDSKVYIVGFDAAETIEGDGKPYRANRYNLTIEAGYHQFVTFMSRVMALPRLLSFSELRIERNPMVTRGTESYEGLESQPRYLSIECTLTSYVFTNLDDGS